MLADSDRYGSHVLQGSRCLGRSSAATTAAYPTLCWALPCPPCDFRVAARDATVLLALSYFPSSDLILSRIAQILEYGHMYHLDVDMQWNIRTFEKLSTEPGLKRFEERPPTLLCDTPLQGDLLDSRQTKSGNAT